METPKNLGNSKLKTPIEKFCKNVSPCSASQREGGGAITTSQSTKVGNWELMKCPEKFVTFPWYEKSKTIASSSASLHRKPGPPSLENVQNNASNSRVFPCGPICFRRPLWNRLLEVKPGFHIVVSDGDVSQQRIGDAAGTLMTIWKRIYSDVPDVLVEIENVELCSTFENVPDASPSCPRRCGDSFLNGNHKFVIGDDGFAQFFTWRCLIMHSRLKITLSNYKNSPPTISLGHVPVACDDMETTSPRGHSCIADLCWDTSASFTTIWKPGFTPV